MRKILSMKLSVALCLFLTILMPGWASNLPSRAKVVQDLGYVIYMPNFSPSKPISQIELMKLVWYHGGRGDFPKEYVQTKDFQAAPKGFDNYITRTMARRFVHRLLGQDLELWVSLPNGGPPNIVGDKLGWWYNTSNTENEPPFVRLTRMETVNRKTISVSFRMFHRIGNLSMAPPLTQIGTGTATLQSGASDWRVTSWQVTRNKHWR